MPPLGRPLHRIVYPVLRERIVSGTYPEGEPLPPQADLARELGVSLSTLRQALDLLERDGYIFRRHGFGTFPTRPKRERVLIVDDDPGSRDLLVNLVEEAGFDALEASSGKEAIARVQAGHFEQIFLDVRMPRESGVKVLPEIRRSAPNTMVIILTSGPRDLAELNEAADWPMIVLRKPFEAAEVARVLRLRYAAQREQPRAV